MPGSPLRRSQQSNFKLISPLVSAYVLFNALSFATLLLEVPIVRLLERLICNRYYRHESSEFNTPGKDIDEALCKLAPIQDKLAIIAGWQISLNALAGQIIASACSVLLLTAVKGY